MLSDYWNYLRRPGNAKKRRQRSTLMTGAVVIATAVSSFSPILAADKGDPEWRKGNDLAKEKKYSLAIAAFTQALRLNPKHPWAYQDRANVYRNTGQIERAESDYERAEKVNKKNYWAPWELGKIHVKRTDYAGSIPFYNESIKRKPDFLWAYFDRGNAYADMMRTKDAIRDFTFAVSQDPKYAMAFMARAAVYMVENKPALAVNDYTAALKVASRDKTMTIIKERARAYEQLGQFDQALADYNAGLRAEPSNADLLNSCGECYVRMKRYKDAVLSYTQVLQMYPDDADTYTARGKAYMQLKQFDKAVADFTKSIDDTPGATAYRARAKAYRLMGKTALASKDEAMALKVQK